MNVFFSINLWRKTRLKTLLMQSAIALFAFGLVQCTSGKSNTPLPTKELKELRKAISHSPQLHKVKEYKLDSLKECADRIPTYELENRCRAYLKIGEEYHAYNADSALSYFHKAQNLAQNISNKELLLRSKISTIDGLSVSGIFTDACNLLEQLEKEEMSKELRVRLWLSARQLYAYMYSYLGQQSNYSAPYRNKYMEYDDSLLNNLPHDNIDYRFLHAERLVEMEHYKEAKEDLQKLLNEMPLASNIYGKAAYQMADVYKKQGDEHHFAIYLTKAAISDVTGCVSEGWALPMLAGWLYENGDLDDAYTYINHSLTDAMTSNARMRTTTIAGMVPNIHNAYQKELSTSNSELRIYIGLVTFLLIVSAFLLATVMKQMRRSHEAQKKLADTSRLQESYLGNFVALCSSYSAKLDSWQKTVTRKISAGQSEELLKMIKSGKITEETEDFHTIIDKAFLELYPDFVEKVNELLREEEQIKLKKPGVLPAELRIYSLIRLGVDESTRIASILQYSANTVYTYRNKMRNKAINRNTFEEDIMKIGYDF
jgi:hypothetical protein